MLDINFILSYWQYVLFGTVILLGFVVYIFDKRYKPKRTFEFKKMPAMEPIKIPTKGKSYWYAVWIWLTVDRQWRLLEDFHFTLDGSNYVIPKGFEFDGASIPKILRTWLSPVGILLIAGIIHDFGYKSKGLLTNPRHELTPDYPRKWHDKTFRDINIIVNGFVVLNYMAYLGVRLGGWFPWNQHRKRDK